MIVNSFAVQIRNCQFPLPLLLKAQHDDYVWY